MRSHPQGQSLLRYQPVCLWYHYNWVWSCHLVSGSDNSGQVYHTTFLPHQGALALVAIFDVFTNFCHKYLQRTAKYSEFLSITLFLLVLAIPLPLGEPTSGSCDWNFPLFCNMDCIECEAFSFLRQEITHRLIIESGRQRRSALSWSVIDQVISEFSHLAPVANQCFRTLVVRLALNVRLSQQQVSTWWFSTVHVTPQLTTNCPEAIRFSTKRVLQSSSGKKKEKSF